MLFNRATTPLNHFIFSNGIFEIWKDEISNHHSLFSVVDFQPGDIVCEFGAAAILPAPSPLTVQVGFNEHIYLQPGVLQYINHSCSPNIFFDLSSFKAICLRAINKGDELFYFYPSTEWEMAEPFQCLCGSANCLGRIAGASCLSKDVIQKYRFSDFISEQLNNKYSK
jgi:hypothetical protein